MPSLKQCSTYFFTHIAADPRLAHCNYVLIFLNSDMRHMKRARFRAVFGHLIKYS